uniref:Mitochondrial inner membrane protein Mpv17 n=1 Tax=Glossina brevipalpis TaxID=37001 RepID=A0A1A9WEV4_9MUSC
MGLGDLLAQHYDGANSLNSIKWFRTVKYASIGFFFIGPALNYWSNIMHPWSCLQRNRTFAVLKQIISDQIYLAPSLNLGLVFLSDILSANSYADTEKRICEKYIFVMKRHYVFWPAVQLFCTFAIQPNLQLLLANTLAVGWFAYLSIMLNNDERAKKKVERIVENRICQPLLDQSYLYEKKKIEEERSHRLATTIEDQNDITQRLTTRHILLCRLLTQEVQDKPKTTIA